MVRFLSKMILLDCRYIHCTALIKNEHFASTLSEMNIKFCLLHTLRLAIVRGVALQLPLARANRNA